MKRFIICLIFPLALAAGEIRQTTINSFMMHPEKESGYFQGWNLYFHNNDYFITINMVVSNIGPGSLNNGVNIIVLEKGKTPVFKEKEFSGREFKSNADKFKLQFYNNTLEQQGNRFILNTEIKDIHLYLIFEPANNGVEISGGKTPIDGNKYLKADIPFSDAKVYGVIIQNNVKKEIYGRGSMEHLITNQEVYKFSTNWFIMKAFTKEGNTIVAGGFTGNKHYPQKYFKTAAVFSPAGKILFSGQALDNEIVKTEFDKKIAYNLVLGEKLYFDDEKKCYLEINPVSPFARINILGNISVLLRTIIEVFFAKPWQIYSTVQTELHCKAQVFTGRGFHSYFLINPE